MQQLLLMNVTHDFFYTDFAELWGTRLKRKIRNEIYVSSRILTIIPFLRSNANLAI